MADGRLPRLLLEAGPASLNRYPENVLGVVLVWVLGIGPLAALRLQPGICFLKGIGDVLEEDKAEDDVLVFGSVHAAPQSIGHLPQFGLVAGGGPVVGLLALCVGRCPSRCSHCVSHSLCYYLPRFHALSDALAHLDLGSAKLVDLLQIQPDLRRRPEIAR